MTAIARVGSAGWRRRGEVDPDADDADERGAEQGAADEHPERARHERRRQHAGGKDAVRRDQRRPVAVAVGDAVPQPRRAGGERTDDAPRDELERLPEVRLADDEHEVGGGDHVAEAGAGVGDHEPPDLRRQRWASDGGAGWAAAPVTSADEAVGDDRTDRAVAPRASHIGPGSSDP